MADFQRTASVHATPAATYDYLADARHLPQWVATMTQAQPTAPDHVQVAADVQGRLEEGEATFHADPSMRRLEWGREGHAYRGSLTVADGDGGDTSTITINLQTHDETDRAEVERALDATMGKIEEALSAS